MKVYGPPLDPRPNDPGFPILPLEHWQVVWVPQPLYKCDYMQEDWVPKPHILFYTQDYLGVKLPNAWDGTFVKVSNGDEFPFGTLHQGTTITIQVGPQGHQVFDNN